MSANRLALLRAVNVGGRKVAAGDLVKLCNVTGCAEVRTVLQSGNVVFTSRLPNERLERNLRAAAQPHLKLDVEFFVRTAGEWHATLKQNPFVVEAREDPAHLLLLALKTAPTTAQVAALRGAIKGRERVAAAGSHLFAYYPDGIGESKVTLALIERHLETRGTGRNWNTAMKIAALLEG
jgi:uncharacterized protein (DUF1697 family)